MRRPTVAHYVLLGGAAFSASVSALAIACSSFDGEAPAIEGGTNGEGAASEGGAEAGDGAPSIDGGGEEGPALFAISGDEPILDIGVTDTQVVWLTTPSPWGGPGHVYSCSKTGPCAAPKSIGAAGAPSGNLTAKGSLAFASELYGFRSILSIDSAGNATSVAALGGYSLATDLQIFGGALYFRTRGETPPTVDGGHRNIVRVWDGGTNTPIANIDGLPVDNFHWMVATSSHLVFANTIRFAACPLSGGCTSLTDWANVANEEPRGLTTSGATIYWSSNTFGSVRTCSPQNGCATPGDAIRADVLSNEKPRAVLWLDDSLFATTEAGSVVSCPLATCQATVRRLAGDSFRQPDGYSITGRSLAVDATHVYYAAADAPKSDGGAATRFRVMRVPRAP